MTKNSYKRSVASSFFKHMQKIQIWWLSAKSCKTRITSYLLFLSTDSISYFQGLHSKKIDHKKLCGWFNNQNKIKMNWKVDFTSSKIKLWKWNNLLASADTVGVIPLLDVDSECWKVSFNFCVLTGSLERLTSLPYKYQLH